MRKTNFKDKKGIALITLIVTIIVLLILAGIGINYMLGNGGLLSFINSTESSTNVAEEREQLEIAIKDAKSGDYLDGRAGGITVEGLQASLDDIVGEGKTVVTSTNGTVSIEETTVGMDIVFIIDISASMNNDIGNNQGPRMKQLVVALNAVLPELAKNEKNRIQIVTYSSANINGGKNTGRPNATARMSDFTQIDSDVNNNNYFSYRDKTLSSVFFEKKISVVGGTYTQDGIYTACEAIENRADKTNIPVIILLTDGTPTYAKSNYLSNPSGTANKGNGNSDNAEVGYYTIQAGLYAKEKIWGDEKSYFYTIGMGIDEDVDLFPSTILSPTKQNLQRCKNAGRYSVSKKLYDLLENEGDVNYVTQAFLEGEMDATVLGESMNTIIEEVIYAEGIQVWFEESNRSYTVNQDGTLSDNYTIIEERPVQNTTSGDK